MNQKFKAVMLIVVLMLVSAGLYAQLTTVKKRKDQPRFPPWVSEKGYWVVESNHHTPTRHIVSFYTNDNVLLHKETIEDIRLNAEKRRVKMKLKKALESTVAASQQAASKSQEPVWHQSIVRSILQ